MYTHTKLLPDPTFAGEPYKTFENSKKTTNIYPESTCQIALFLLTLFGYIGNKLL